MPVAKADEGRTAPAGVVAVVTGAASGLGFAVARELAESGARTVLLDRDREAVLRAAESLCGESLGIACDVADEQAVAAAALEVDSTCGRCGILVNNAAIYRRAPLAGHPVELWDAIVSVNLRGYFLCTRAFGEAMLSAGAGVIVNISSIAAHAPTPDAVAYCASKAGVLALTRQTAVEWGPSGIRANAVSPAFMNTSMSVARYAEDPVLARSRARRVPVGRVAEVEEVARVVSFLAGPDAAYVNGAELIVDGGLTQTLSQTFPRPERG